ncbi:MAG: flagellar biosynthetic protein FliQ [Planctomycetota bacterium]|nr:MAG: flagellar biosynthetic protein FliQ [Planctomycetota bacterium]
MGSDVLVTLLQDMLRLSLMLIMPPLMTALIIGLCVGLFQAVTSIQEQTLAFVPKILGVVVALMFAGHFMLRMLVEYSYTLFAALPSYGAM